MPNIPVSSPLNYVGVFLLILGFFLVLSGFRIIKIEKVTVTPGRKTWGVGLVMLAIGIVFLLPEISGTLLLPSTTPAVAVPGSTIYPTPLSNTHETVLSIYDDFNKLSYENSFDRSKWDFEGASLDQAAQQNSIMVLRQANATPSSPNTRLYSREYKDAPLESPMVFETKMMLSPDEHDGSIGFQVLFFLPSGEIWSAGCTIIEEGPWALCSESASWAESHFYEAEREPTDWGKWHTFRIEIDPEMMMFSYYIDGEMKGTHMGVFHLIWRYGSLRLK